MTKSISEYVRLQEELEHFREVAKSPNYSKGTREYALAEARKLESQLGIESEPYNHND
jgi:hypothetical protein